MRRTVYPSPVTADRIQEVFDENHLRDNKVAADINVNRKTVASWRHGYSEPSVRFIRYICATYHKDAKWLLDL